MNEERIKELQGLVIKSLVQIIDDDYVLLDVPNHDNIGDNLIWEGELIFLKKYIKYKCKYQANYLNWEEKKIQDTKIILFHGGGNWGDLYRGCQDLRNYITSNYHDKKIIVFPQTVWYNNPDLISSDCKVYENHPNVTICVRDQLSYDTLRNYIAETKLLLLPDMAFFVEPPKLATGTKQLFMLRNDKEINKQEVLFTEKCEVSDWPTFSNISIIYLLQRKWMGCKRKLSIYMQKKLVLRKFVDPAFGLNSKNNRHKNINKGYDFFSKYKDIYTTRLHGMILGILMNKNIYIVDNKYNKCTNFYKTWLTSFEGIYIYHPKER